MIVPTDKYLMADYREILGTPDAPQMIDTENPIIPVALVNNGLPRPNSKQEIKKYNVSKINTTVDVQVATASSTKRLFYIGAHVRVDALGVNTCVVFDATSGTGSCSDANTDLLVPGVVANTILSTLYTMNLPIECKKGIRVSIIAAAGQNVSVDVFYMEESLI